MSKSVSVPEPLQRAFVNRVALSLTETAAVLGMDQKIFRAHVRAGNIGFLKTGLGAERPRRAFTLAQVVAFLVAITDVEQPIERSRTRSEARGSSAERKTYDFMDKAHRPRPQAVRRWIAR